MTYISTSIIAEWQNIKTALKIFKNPMFYKSSTSEVNFIINKKLIKSLSRKKKLKKVLNFIFRVKNKNKY